MGGDVFFILMGAIMVLAMHAGFAFLEVGTVRKRSQVNALVKILVDFSGSTLAYFFVGFSIAYGMSFLDSAPIISGAAGTGYQGQGYDLVKYFFLLTFAAAVPAIISGGIAERAKFYPQLIATFLIVGLIYPFFEGMAWNNNHGFQDMVESLTGARFHDFAGSIVVHAMGGWIALGAVIMLGNRKGRFTADGRAIGMPPSNIVWLALGAWILSVGWFGFNVMSAQRLEAVTGLVAVNSLMAMVGGVITALLVGRNDPGFVHNGALAGLVAVCAGSDVMHPVGALATGGLAGALFVWAFNFMQDKLRVDDVLGVWPLHGLCGTLGGLLCGVFGMESLGGMGGVTFMSQLIGTAAGVLIGLVSGFAVYGALKATVGIRLSEEQEFNGADLSIHKITSTPDEDIVR
ncbi:MAG: ammonium transporter [Rhodospirillaceae bacterium]|nr:ammonium transporter [Rhodospirillaceae bacterium]